MPDDAAMLTGRCVAQGRAVPEDLLGPLTDSSPLVGRPGALASRLADDGYLFLRAGVPATLAIAARHGVLGRLAGVDEIVDPEGDARATGRSRRVGPRPHRRPDARCRLGRLTT